VLGELSGVVFKPSLIEMEESDKKKTGERSEEKRE
jgi:hypothetical protein